MSPRVSHKFKSLRQLGKINRELERRERDLVLGHNVDIAELQAMLKSFIEDCQRKLQDERPSTRDRQRLRTYILRWQLLKEDLDSGWANAHVIPQKILVQPKAPLPEPSSPKAMPAYRSPTVMIRERFGWPVVLSRPSKTRLFNLDELPCFPPASLLQNACQEG